MKDILKYIPGFRTDVKWKKIVATMYYVFTLLALGAGFDAFIFSLAMPVLVFSISHFIKAKRNKRPTKRIALVIAFSLIASVGALNYQGAAVEVGKEIEEPEAEEVVEEEVEEPQVEEKQEEPEEVEVVEEEEPKVEEVQEEEAQEEPAQENFENVGDLKVHYLDVGQGDSAFIELPNGETMLIDGGTRGSGSTVLSYMNSLNVDHIDYLIGTHPHEDHIGGLIEVINRKGIGKIYMPKKTHTTKTYEDLILAIRNKDKKIIAAEAGHMILDKEGLSLEIIAPEAGCSDSNLNDHSVVIKLKYKNNSFIFTGDAEKASEGKMINRGHDLKSDVLKVGHHGSDTSTTNAFLDKVAPSYAVISCGSSNRYGHPDDETMNKLNAKNIEVFRTDTDGTIVATSDGSVITFDKKASSGSGGGSASVASESVSSAESSSENIEEQSEVKAPETDNVEEVYITNSGSKYHRGNCSSLSKSKIPISLSKAKEGYGPCKRCKPSW